MMRLVAAGRLTRFTHELLTASGSSAEEAAIVADHLVSANLAGHDSHGVGMLPAYMENLGLGHLVANRQPRLVSRTGAISVWDGQRGYGQVIARAVTLGAVDQARAEGAAIVGIRNSHHMGRIGAYGELAATAGLVSLHFVNVVGHTPLVAPHGGGAARFGTNPICIAIPTKGGPGNGGGIVLDMATSTIAFGKVRVAHNKGETLPPGVIIDSAGRPSTATADMFADPRGALLPFGLHKGGGLSLVAELLAGALTGGGTIQPANPRNKSIVNNMLMIVISPDRLVDPDWLGREVAAVIDYVKSPPAADPARPILIAGEPERAAAAARRESGIPIDAATWAELETAAAPYGVVLAA